jgi:hypothetical protein
MSEYRYLTDKGKVLTKSEQNSVRMLEKAKRKHKSSKSHSKANKSKEGNRYDNDAVKRLVKEIKKIRLELTHIKLSSWASLIKARNLHTQRMLRAEKTSVPNFDIFCVSNAHYASWKGVECVEGKRLSVVDTGLPALRSYIRSFAAPARSRAQEDYIEHDFSVFIQSLNLWSGAFTDMNVNKLLADVKALQKDVSLITAKYVAELGKNLHAHIVKHLEENQIKIVDAALQHWAHKQNLAWQTIRALVRRNGNFQRKNAAVSWNEEFSSTVRTYVEFRGWNAFARTQAEMSFKMERELSALLEKVLKIVEGHPARMMLPRASLEVLFRAMKQGIRRSCEDFQNATTKEHRDIKLNLTLDRESAFFTQAMVDAYEQCRGQSAGKGSKGRMEAAMTSYLSLRRDSSPFSVMLRLLSEAIGADAEKSIALLSKEVKDIMVQIHDMFKDMLHPKQTEETEENLKQLLRSYLDESALQQFEDIKLQLKAIKRRYTSA